MAWWFIGFGLLGFRQSLVFGMRSRVYVRDTGFEEHTADLGAAEFAE